MDMRVSSEVRQAAVSLVITRADGTVDDLGVVSYYHRSAWRRLVFALKHRLGVRQHEAELFGKG